MAQRLSSAFFNCDADKLALKLLGKTICLASGGEITRKTITETEAYGMNDTASHTFKGRTKRNNPMFLRGGTVYVYLCYGIHEILNFSAGHDGDGQGVMIRGIEGATGPGNVTKKLGIDRSLNYEDVATSSKIWIEQGVDIDDAKVKHLKRVGINYASQADQDKLWRFKVDLI